MNGRVLLVDDEAAIRKLLAAELRKGGYECEEAEGFVAAKKKFEAGEFDVMITDKNMPLNGIFSEGGMELLRWSRQNRTNMAVIVMTGYATSDSADEALRQGAADYLMKPLDLAVLHRKVDRIREFQRFVDPSGILGLYARIMQEIIRTVGRGTPELEDKLNQMHDRLDQFFHAFRMMEQALIEHWRRLEEISSCAEEARDQLSLDCQTGAEFEHITMVAAERL